MKTAIKTVLVMALLFALGLSGIAKGKAQGKPEEVAAAFDKVLKDLSESRLRPFKSRFGRLGSHINPFKYNEPAKRFAEQYGAKSIGFLKKQAVGGFGKRAHFAALVLASLSSEKSALDALKELASREGGYMGRPAFLAISFMPPDRARAVAEEIAFRPGPDGPPSLALDMLRGLGGAETLKRLKEIDQKKKSKRFNDELKQTINSIEYRLNKIPTAKEREEWARQELVYWQAPYPPFRSAYLASCYAAGKLVEHGERFSLKFLELPLSYGDDTAAHLLGMQKEEEAIPLLKKYAAALDLRGEACRAALGWMGTRQALRALEELIQPEDERLNYDVANVLGFRGDKKSLELLRSLAKDERFGEARVQFRSAADNIERRLKKEKK